MPPMLVAYSNRRKAASLAAPRRGKQYGDSFLVLKDARLRCTFSPEDSANLKAWGGGWVVGSPSPFRKNTLSLSFFEGPPFFGGFKHHFLGGP